MKTVWKCIFFLFAGRTVVDTNAHGKAALRAIDSLWHLCGLHPHVPCRCVQTEQVKNNRMDYPGFLDALTQIAALLGVPEADVHRAIATSRGPLVNAVTLPRFVRLHDAAPAGARFSILVAGAVTLIVGVVPWPLLDWVRNRTTTAGAPCGFRWI